MSTTTPATADLPASPDSPETRLRALIARVEAMPAGERVFYERTLRTARSYLRMMVMLATPEVKA